MTTEAVRLKSVLLGAVAYVGWLMTVGSCGAGQPSGQPSISAASYDRGCATVADCVFGYDGPVSCCGVGCANAAITQRALTRYMSDLARDEQAACSGTSGICNGPDLPRGTVPVCQGPGRLECNAGLCVFEAPDAASTSD
jgi:hypothetical protein